MIVKFIVEAQKEDRQDHQYKGCKEMMTLCADCAENPRFCNNPPY
jgi:hypothetical protein